MGCPQRVTRARKERGQRVSALVGNLGRPGLAHDGDDDLAGIDEILLDLADDLAREAGGSDVVDLVRFDEDAHLASRLYGVRLLHAVEAVGDVLQGFEPLEVEFDGVAAGAWASGADGVCCCDDERLDGTSVVVVMLVDGSGYRGRQGVATSYFLTEFDVRALELVSEGLPSKVASQEGMN